jgi:hypothetical protein
LTVLLFEDGIQQGANSVVEAPRQLVGFMLLAVLIGAFIGAALGLIVGILIGLLISTITIRAFRPLRDEVRYVQVVQWTSALVGGLGTLISAPLLSRVFIGELAFTDSIGMLIMFSLAPALLAGLAIKRGSGQVAMWYVRAATGTASAPDRDAHR